jgi:hypothetical protein
LVRKGLAAPSLLGDEEQLYWESEQKILPGAPMVPRRIVLPNLPRPQNDESPQAAKTGEPVLVWPTASKTEQPMIAGRTEEPEAGLRAAAREPAIMPFSAPAKGKTEEPRTVESRKIEKPVPILAPRVFEEPDIEGWDGDDEWITLAVQSPKEARKSGEPVRKAKSDDAPAAVPRTATAAAPATPPDGLVKPHKMMITLTPAEFERLGIAAVKKGVTRHQIIRHALDLHMAELTQEYGSCGCMANGGSCNEGCGTD